ncbi:MAG: GIY-YIG nuclease family protein [Dehalococcoidia bacterium]
MSEHATGVYLLFITARGRARVGRLGEQWFDGTYVYVGSARGPGGIKRLRRHYQVARGQRSGGRWHIDHLLALGRLEAALFIHTREPVECLLARRVGRVAQLAVPGFGSSDCRCPGHLFQVEGDREGVVGAAAGLGGYRWVTSPARPQKERPPGDGGP